MRVRKNPDQLAQASGHARFRPDAIQIRVGLQNVQVIVHGLLLVHVLVAQARLGAGLRPVAVADLDVAAEFRVVRVALDQFKQFLRAGQRGGRAKGAMKFRQRINVKRLAVDFFGIVHHPAGVVQPPERAAVLRVPKFVHHEIKRAVGHVAINAVRAGRDGRRKTPTESGCSRSVPWAACGRACRSLESQRHPAAVFAVQRRAAPERQDMAEQLFADAARKNLPVRSGLDHLFLSVVG